MEPIQIMVTCPTCKGEGLVEVTTHISREDGAPDGHREVCGMCEGTGIMVAVCETVLEVGGVLEVMAHVPVKP